MVPPPAKQNRRRLVIMSTKNPQAMPLLLQTTSLMAMHQICLTMAMPSLRRKRSRSMPPSMTMPPILKRTVLRQMRIRRRRRRRTRSLRHRSRPSLPTSHLSLLMTRRPRTRMMTATLALKKTTRRRLKATPRRTMMPSQTTSPSPTAKPQKKATSLTPQMPTPISQMGPRATPRAHRPM